MQFRNVDSPFDGEILNARFFGGSMKSLIFVLVGIVAITAQKASAHVPTFGEFVASECAPIKYQANGGINPIMQVCLGHVYREPRVSIDAVSIQRWQPYTPLVLLVGESKIEVCKVGAACKYDRRETLTLYSQEASVDMRLKIQIVTRGNVRTVVGRDASNYSGVLERVMMPRTM